jgi:hypothetical protein
VIGLFDPAVGDGPIPWLRHQGAGGRFTGSLQPLNRRRRHAIDNRCGIGDHGAAQWTASGQLVIQSGLEVITALDRGATGCEFALVGEGRRLGMCQITVLRKSTDHVQDP